MDASTVTDAERDASDAQSRPDDDGSARGTAPAALLETAAASMGGVILRRRLDPDGGGAIQHVAGDAQALLGTGRQTLAEDPKILRSLAAAEDRPALGAAFKRACATGEAIEIEFRLGAEGTHRGRKIRLEARPAADAPGSELWDMVLQDVTALRAAQDEADLAHRRLVDAIESLSEGFALWDHDDRLVLKNTRMHTIYPQMAEHGERGARFEDVVRANVGAGHYDIGDVSQEEYVRWRVAQHRTPRGFVEQQLSDGRWIRISERRTRDGGVVGVWADVTEFKEREEALRHSRAQLEGITDHIPGIVFSRVRSPDGHITYPFVSSSVHDVIGITAEQMMNQPEVYFAKVHPDDLDELADAAERSMQDKSMMDVEFRVYPRPGEMLWLRSMSTPVEQDDGSIVWNGVALDVTDRKRAEDREQKAHRLLSDTIEGIPAWLMVFDANDRLVLSNGRAERNLLEISRAREIGARYERMLRTAVETGFFVNDDPDAFIEDWMAFHADPQGSRVTQLNDGRWLRSLERRTHDGGTIAIMTDITELRSHEEALRESEDRLSTIAGNLPGAVFRRVRYPDGTARFPYVSPGVAALYGVTPEELMADANAFYRRVHPDHRERVLRLVDNSARTLCRCDYECPVLTAEGEERWIRSISEPVRQDDGSTVWDGVVLDISDQKRAEAALREAMEQAEVANRAKSDFLARMSHELRTPLNAVIGFSEMIDSEVFGPLGDERYRGYLADIHASGTHLLSLINDILDLSKIEARKYELQESEVDLRAAIEDSQRFFAKEATQRGIQLSTRTARDLPPVFVDARAFKQILINLLSNAVKFTGEGGRISAGARLLADGRVAVTVSDTGLGMDAEEIPRALAPFEQTGSALSRPHEGTGLGLPLVKSLVEMHGGSLSIRSRKDRGTRVTVRLPADRVRWPAVG